MKILIAILSCHQFRERADAQRATWVSDVQGADVHFFLGGGTAARDDEVILKVGDGYQDLPAKLIRACQWARANDYDFLYKSDDDAYVVPERLLKSGFEKRDYTGRVRGPSGIFPAPYCSGFGYWLSRKAINIIADAEWKRGINDDAEDRFVANTLLRAGIVPYHDYRYAVMTSNRHASSYTEPPRIGNQIIAACEFSVTEMRKIHDDWLQGKPSECKTIPLPEGPLSKICIVIKTFLRDGCLYRCLEGLERNFPEVKLVIVDDGHEASKKISLYASLRLRGHICEWLPFDSGFGAKANAAIPHCDRPYVLIGSDDFDFSHPAVRGGVEKLLAVLEHDPSMHIASGRVNDRAYESCFQISDHSVREIPAHREIRELGQITYRVCDLTVNYSLIRRECFGPEKLHWDETVKIGGGEHGAFYIDAQRLGYGVCVVDSVNVREMSWNFAQVHPSYPQFRQRARLPGRPCLKARGIDRWYLQDGSWELT